MISRHRGFGRHYLSHSTYIKSKRHKRYLNILALHDLSPSSHVHYLCWLLQACSSCSSSSSSFGLCCCLKELLKEVEMLSSRETHPPSHRRQPTSPKFSPRFSGPNTFLAPKRRSCFGTDFSRFSPIPVPVFCSETRRDVIEHFWGSEKKKFKTSFGCQDNELLRMRHFPD